ncbi:hypothetical protein ACVIGB_001030 [Bradyrhizobium sp. USDA 4341]
MRLVDEHEIELLAEDGKRLLVSLATEGARLRLLDDGIACADLETEEVAQLATLISGGFAQGQRGEPDPALGFNDQGGNEVVFRVWTAPFRQGLSVHLDCGGRIKGTGMFLPAGEVHRLGQFLTDFAPAPSAQKP